MVSMLRKALKFEIFLLMRLIKSWRKDSHT
jgi:hypothetical protein